MPQDRERDRRGGRRARETGGARRVTAADSSAAAARRGGARPADVPRLEESARARPTDDAPWAESRPSEAAGASAARFYSRARNRYSQWEGRGMTPRARDEITHRGLGPDWWASSGYGARGPRDYPFDVGGGRGAGYRESAGYGYGYGPGYGPDALSDREWGAPEPERRRARWHREPLAAREIMTRNPRAAHPDSSIREVAQIMRDENTGIVPVVDEEERLQGIVTDRDIVMRSIPEGKDPTAMWARDLMTEDVDAVTPDESVHEVVRLMGDRQIRRVPVVDRDDKLVGIISMADVALRADYDIELQNALEEISSKRSFWSKLFG